MAVKLIEREWRNAVKLNINIYQMDSVDDFPLLPEADTGSRALVADKSKKFIVNTAGVWVEDNRPGGFDVGGTGAAELPFGETTTVKEVLAECQPEFDAEVGQFGIRTKFHLEAGQKYIVTVNGIEYHSTAFNPSDVGESIEGVEALLFNDEAIADGEKMVFIICSYIEGLFETFGYGGYVQLVDGSTTLTISIRQEVTEVKKISGKYVEGMGYSEIANDVVLVNNATIPANATTVDGAANLVLTPGETYTVIYDGVRYENLVCFVDQETGFPTIGAPFNGVAEQYGFSFRKDGSVLYCQRYSMSGVNTVTIIGTVETIHPIDPKFLPSAFVVNFATADMQNWTADKTADEIAAAVNSGKEVYGSVMGMKVDLIGVAPNGYVTFGRIFPDAANLMSYHFGVTTDNSVQATMASLQMTPMG